MLEFHPLWQPNGYSHDRLTQRLADFNYSGEVLSRSAVAIRELWQPAQR